MVTFPKFENFRKKVCLEFVWWENIFLNISTRYLKTSGVKQYGDPVGLSAEDWFIGTDRENTAMHTANTIRWIRMWMVFMQYASYFTTACTFRTRQTWHWLPALPFWYCAIQRARSHSVNTRSSFSNMGCWWLDQESQEGQDREQDNAWLNFWNIYTLTLTHCCCFKSKYKH